MPFAPAPRTPLRRPGAPSAQKPRLPTKSSTGAQAPSSGPSPGNGARPAAQPQSASVGNVMQSAGSFGAAPTAGVSAPTFGLPGVAQGTGQRPPQFGGPPAQAPAEGAPAADAGQGGDSAAEDYDKMFEDLLSQKDASWGNIEAMQQANAAAMSRRVQAMQGAAGRSVAGGWMGNVMQAFLGGQQQRMGARSQFDQERQQLAMDIMARREERSRYETGMEREDARSERELAAELAAAGWSSDDIEAYFAGDTSVGDKYGKSAEQSQANQELINRARSIHNDPTMSEKNKFAELGKLVEQMLNANPGMSPEEAWNIIAPDGRPKYANPHAKTPQQEANQPGGASDQSAAGYDAGLDPNIFV